MTADPKKLELKPCPCCGGAAKLYMWRSEHFAQVECMECGMRTATYEEREEQEWLPGRTLDEAAFIAIERWEGRPFPRMACCPLCGAEPFINVREVITDEGIEHIYWVECQQCGAMSAEESGDVDECRLCWNRGM